jgi:hypothetical protein
MQQTFFANLQTQENLLLKKQATKCAGFNYCIITDNNFAEFNKLII